jgi:hypothetical protein
MAELRTGTVPGKAMSNFDPIEEATATLSSASEGERALREAEDEQDLKWLIADHRGRRFLRRRLAELGVFHTSFTGEALGTAFNEGKRGAGLRLLSFILRIAPGAATWLFTEDARNG